MKYSIFKGIFSLKLYSITILANRFPCKWPIKAQVVTANVQSIYFTEKFPQVWPFHIWEMFTLHTILNTFSFLCLNTICIHNFTASTVNIDSTCGLTGRSGVGFTIIMVRIQIVEKRGTRSKIQKPIMVLLLDRSIKSSVFYNWGRHVWFPTSLFPGTYFSSLKQ